MKYVIVRVDQSLLRARLHNYGPYDRVSDAVDDAGKLAAKYSGEDGHYYDIEPEQAAVARVVPPSGAKVIYF